MRKNAQLWKVKNSNIPIVKIEYTLYELKRGHGMSMLESDASVMWDGVCAPKGARLLATIKVPENNARWAMWALRKWIG